MPSRNLMRRLAAVGTAILCLVLLMGVTSSDSADSLLRLRVDLVENGFNLSWATPRSADGSQIEIQVRGWTHTGNEWVREHGWQRVPLASTDTTAMFTSTVPGHWYQFRARENRGRWTEPIKRLFVETTLPVLRIDTEFGEPARIAKDDYLNSTITVDPNVNGNDLMQSSAKIRGRGNSTWYGVENKKSYQIKFPDRRSILGMAPSKRWVLRANFFDRSQLRNWTANQIAEETGVAWVPDTDWVELILDGDYRGIYEVSEKIDIDRHKLDIGELDAQNTTEDEISGGYILEMEAPYRPDKRGWHSEWTDLNIWIHRPKPSESNEQQFRWIRGLVDEFETALYSEDFTDPETGYRQYFDTESFVAYWIVEEITLDSDAFRVSTYLYKPQNDGRLHFGPPWDFDNTLGNPRSVLDPTWAGWFTIISNYPGSVSNDPWTVRLFEDPKLVDQVISNWNQVLPGIRRIPGEILTIAPQLEPAKVNDLRRWFDEEVEIPRRRYGDVLAADDPEFLAAWLTDRIDWIDGHLEQLRERHDPLPMIPRRQRNRGN